jgi:lysophospholipase L1-like esterase
VPQPARIAGLVAILLAGVGGLALFVLSRPASLQAARIVPRSPLAAQLRAQHHGLPVLTSCAGAGDHARRAPALVVVGASFTAGVGPGDPYRSWAVLLARKLRWNAVVYGIPGAGYVRAGSGRNGPVMAEVARLGLRALRPALVIVQAGHDDIGVPAQLEKQRVAQTVRWIHAEVPGAQIALLTVFAGHAARSAAARTDRAIVAAGTAADPHVIVMDPLAGRWTFPRVRDGLHPTAAGSQWLAAKVAGILREDGVRAGGATSPASCTTRPV